MAPHQVRAYVQPTLAIEPPQQSTNGSEASLPVDRSRSVRVVSMAFTCNHPRTRPARPHPHSRRSIYSYEGRRRRRRPTWPSWRGLSHDVFESAIFRITVLSGSNVVDCLIACARYMGYQARAPLPGFPA